MIGDNLLIRTALLSIFYFLILLYFYKDYINNFFPISDNIVIFANSFGDLTIEKVISWFTEGYKNHFLIYGDLSQDAYNFMRPMFNFLTWLLYKISGDSFSIYSLFGLFLHALNGGLIYYSLIILANATHTQAFLGSAIYFFHLETINLAASYSFVQDHITLLIIILTLLFYTKGKTFLTFLTVLIGTFTKEQFLLIPITLFLNELIKFIREKRKLYLGRALIFISPFIMYTGIKLVYFHDIGTGGNLNFASYQLLKFMFTPFDLTNLFLPFVFFQGGFVEGILQFIKNSTALDKISVIINITVIILLFLSALKSRSKLVIIFPALIYILSLTFIKFVLDPSSKRFLLYPKYFSLLGLIQSYGKNRYITVLISVIFAIQMHNIFINIPIENPRKIREALALRNEACWEFLKRLKECNRGGKIYIAGTDACLLYGIKGTAELFNINAVKLFNQVNFFINYNFPGEINSSEWEKGKLYVVKIRNIENIGKFFSLFENIDRRRFFKIGKIKGENLIVSRENIHYVIRGGAKCRHPDCEIEGVDILVYAGSKDVLFYNTEKGSKCFY